MEIGKVSSIMLSLCPFAASFCLIVPFRPEGRAGAGVQSHTLYGQIISKSCSFFFLPKNGVYKYFARDHSFGILPAPRYCWKRWRKNWTQFSDNHFRCKLLIDSRIKLTNFGRVQTYFPSLSCLDRFCFALRHIQAPNKRAGYQLVASKTIHHTMMM